jgi:hypothetical protein
MPAFIPSYEAALFFVDLTTAEHARLSAMTVMTEEESLAWC